jgi:hypothetical protein
MQLPLSETLIDSPLPPREPVPFESYVYVHVCCLHHWQDIFANLIHKIKDSGLYEIVKEIRCGVVGDSADASVFDDPKIAIVGHSHDVTLYETSTLNLLHEHAQREEFYVLYVHTKGVSHGPESTCFANVRDWVEYLCHFNIYRHQTCRALLQTYDAVGVNLLGGEHVHDALHYSGNFWWSRASYIRTLKPCEHINHNAPEFWLTETRAGSYLSLWQSGVNHYNEPYPPSRYVGAETPQPDCRTYP